MRSYTHIAIATNLLLAIAAPAQTLPVSEPTQRQQQEAGQAQAMQWQIQSAMSRVDGAWIVQEIKKLQEQQEQLLLDEAGASGRERGIEKAISQYTAMTRERADSDPAVKEFEKVVAARESQVKDMQERLKIGICTPAETLAASALLAQSHADLAAAKQRAAGGSQSSDALDAWNREAMNLSIEKMDRHARLDYIAARLEKLNRLDEDLTDLTDASNNLAYNNMLIKNPFGAAQPEPEPGAATKPAEVGELIKRLKADQANLAAAPSTRPAAGDPNPAANSR
jgi:hypothetical protein